MRLCESYDFIDPRKNVHNKEKINKNFEEIFFVKVPKTSFDSLHVCHMSEMHDKNTIEDLEDWKEKSNFVLIKQRFWFERLIYCHFRDQSPQSSHPEITYAEIIKLPRHTYVGLVEIIYKAWLDKEFDPYNFAGILKCIFVLFSYDSNEALIKSLHTNLVIDAINQSKEFIYYAVENSKQVNIVKSEAYISYRVQNEEVLRENYPSVDSASDPYQSERTRFNINNFVNILNDDLKENGFDSLVIVYYNWRGMSRFSWEKSGITKISYRTYRSIEEFRSSLQKITAS
ncbi:7447_t:CDS:2 [Diversispora eburnea]|uniref:7447_t:CDS:1 n=1 Tax=Diversispora eburnea TaxID=1213867 RepID=A0A9N9F9I7_9GLOM|nr:7447_t:CDS:2 [Diversispora eburnea]